MHPIDLMKGRQVQEPADAAGRPGPEPAGTGYDDGGAVVLHCSVDDGAEPSMAHVQCLAELDDDDFSPPQSHPWLTSSVSLSSTMTTFRVQEYTNQHCRYRYGWLFEVGGSSDLNVPEPTTSPNVLKLNALLLADYALLAQDAVVHHQLEEADKLLTHVLRRAESVRSNRWGL